VIQLVGRELSEESRLGTQSHLRHEDRMDLAGGRIVSFWRDLLDLRDVYAVRGTD
jgi:hypothetical protein